MASRKKEDCNEILVTAYDKAVIIYAERYPKAPQPFITCTYRPDEEQLALFNQPTDGKDNNGNGIIDDKSEKVTQAKPGESPHNYLPSQAFDIAFINTITQKLDWGVINFKRFAEIIIEIQPLIEWGGGWIFKDAPHYQMRNWRNFIKK